MNKRLLSKIDSEVEQLNGLKSSNPEVAGKIAMIDRGLCFFEQKTANAEEAGAIAVIICNFEDSAMGMTGTPDIPNPSWGTFWVHS